jgi:hypothetical protein
MASFFSADYWKAFYFKAMGGQETAVDPNAMSGSFAGSSSWTGTLDLPAGAISGSFAGSSEFSGALDGAGEISEPDGHGARRLTREEIADYRRRQEASRREAKRYADELAGFAADESGAAPVDEASPLAVRITPDRVGSASEPVGAVVVDVDAAPIRGPGYAEQQAELLRRDIALAAQASLAAMAEAELARAEAEQLARRMRDEEDVLVLLLAA